MPPRSGLSPADSSFSGSVSGRLTPLSMSTPPIISGPGRSTWMHASYGLGATTGPLLVTLLLSDGLSWHATYGTMAATLTVLGWVFTMTRRRWVTPPERHEIEPPPRCDDAPSAIPTIVARQRRRPGAILSTLSFTAVETGIESGAGIWGYIFLTAGRGLSHGAAGVAVAAYWAMMFVGRMVLGPVAERIGSKRVLSGAVVRVSVGAALMTVPGPVALAVIGMMALGLAAAPIFPPSPSRRRNVSVLETRAGHRGLWVFKSRPRPSAVLSCRPA